jgi:hypothetical protein
MNVTYSHSANLCIGVLLANPKLYRATKYLSDKLTVKATRQHKFNRHQKQATFIVTLGRPNYAERAFIAKCKKAGEPFPVKKVQLK